MQIDKCNKFCRLYGKNLWIFVIHKNNEFKLTTHIWYSYVYLENFAWADERVKVCCVFHKVLFILLKTPPRVLYEKYSTRGHVERQIQHEAKPSAVFISRHAPKCCIFCTYKFRWCFKGYIVFSVTIEL